MCVCKQGHFKVCEYSRSFSNCVGGVEIHDTSSYFLNSRTNKITQLQSLLYNKMFTARTLRYNAFFYQCVLLLFTVNKMLELILLDSSSADR